MTLGSDGLVTRDRVVRLAVLLCLLNLVLVGGLAATGTLKTAERGDIDRTHVTHIGGDRVTLPESSPGFVDESPTDADVFYNTVRLVKNGGSLYHGNGHDPFVQLIYNYTPALYPLFVVLSLGGYVAFKLIWLVLSIGATMAGTVALLNAERGRLDRTLSQPAVGLLAVASVGFQPMVTNYKVGQTTPFMYLFVCLSWWLFRRRSTVWSGLVLVGSALFKPYFVAPLAVGGRRNHARVLAGFAVGVVLLNVLSVVVFDVQTLLAYYERLYTFAAAEGEAVSYDRFADWSPTHVRPFYWLGPLESVVRGLFVGLSLFGAALHVFEVEDEPLGVCALSLTAVVLGLRTSTGVDMAMLLVPVVLLGVWLYERDSTLLAALFVAFCCFMAHEYVLEVFVGAGTAVPVIGRHEALVVSLLPVIQPATYGLVLLFAIALVRFRTIRARLPAELQP